MAKAGRALNTKAAGQVNAHITATLDDRRTGSKDALAEEASVAQSPTAGYSEALSSFVAVAAAPPRATLLAASARAARTGVFFLSARPGTSVGKLPVGARAAIGNCTVCQGKPWGGGAQKALVLERPRCLATSPRTDNGHRVPARLEWLGHIGKLTPMGADMQLWGGRFGKFNTFCNSSELPRAQLSVDSFQGSGQAADCVRAGRENLQRPRLHRGPSGHR